MRKILAFSAFAAIATAIPAGAQPAAGMSAFDYYVGAWTCAGGPTSRPPAQNVSFTATMDGGVLRELVSVPVQGDIKTPISVSMAISYDGKGHYVQTQQDSFGFWEVSSAPTWTGNTEEWTDLAISDGKLGHGQKLRADRDHFTSTGYGPTGATPTFKASCQRRSS